LSNEADATSRVSTENFTSLTSCWCPVIRAGNNKRYISAQESRNKTHVYIMVTVQTFQDIYGNFNKARIHAQVYILPTKTEMVYLMKLWKEVVVAYFEVPTQHLPGGTQESTKTFHYNSWSPG
jgi:hypothetical protein